MRKAFILTLLVLMTAAIAACGNKEDSQASGQKEDSSHWKEIKDKGELVVGTSGTLFPASYYPEGGEQLTGYDVEVMREAAKRLNLDLKFQEYGIDGLLSAMKSGRVDMVINDMEITEDRKNEFTFSTPYKYSYSTMIVRQSDLSGIKTLEDLKGKTHGGGATTVFSKIAEHFGAKTKTYGNVTNDVYLRDVENGRTDFIINDYYLQSLALKAMPEIKVQLHPDLQFHQTESAIVMPKEAGQMKKDVDAVIKEMREDGTLTRISKKFFGGKDASKKPEQDIREIKGLDL
ncbi:transporter substrate-binding domain-containing protein [Halobacillus salinarum]|uniref:Transporter substrate-binding domain-containing protein n=1 Tax=Halobacillus salinarum TaxID=2932257 RepID=A0ABY4EIG9_9BACI|nr:transporter substrate-binding domain-containing protein [Halobacillus salinarum]UOQ43843.1 transporter substrate-binding domain-containing protein [Halobacillus salinarum]